MSLPAPPYRLGLDLGSISLKCVVLDSSGHIVFKRYDRIQGRPRQTVLRLLERMAADIGAAAFTGAVVTGSGKDLIAGPAGVDAANEILAHATGAWTACPEVRSVIEIGGQDSKFISVGRSADGTHFLQDHAFNELCAAGTGAFLDQQAERLGVSIDRFGVMADGAEHIARMAGRCSVFAKSDMIHLQQKAVPVDGIAAGLCYALARHYLAHLCRGRTPEAPILFQGGVAANPGVVRAFRDLLTLEGLELIVPDHFEVMGALGAAVIAGGRPPRSPLAIVDMIAALSVTGASAAEVSDLEPLVRKRVTGPPRAAGVGCAAGRLVMGIDVGSVSTKAVVVDTARNLVAAAYLPTAGNPIAALRNAVRDLRESVPEEARIAHAAATGSGRHLARVLIGGGSVVDEISAQAAAAAFTFPDADTVIEIGGQDSKFIRLSRGAVAGFRMNRACAAGTGAFLEEQAGRLGIDISCGFAEAAFDSPTPVRLGSRCTVFMDTDLVHHLQRGASARDLCAGLAYAIGRNYLEKVVGAEPIGAGIVFQGGVARNPAVHAVFEKLLGRDIRVHPRPEISGALGAAFTALEEISAGTGGRAFRLGELKIGGVGASFECRCCENRCEVRKITAGGEGSAYFGSACGRFEKEASGPAPAEDAFSIRERLLHAEVKSPPGAPTRGELGLPLTLTMSDYLPFWGTFFQALGFALRLSDATHRPMVEAGLRRVPAEFCHPIKILFGHVQNLLDRGTRRIFIPHLRLFTAPGENTPWYACPYTQAAPYVVRENSAPDAEILTLEYPVAGETARWITAVSKTLRIDQAEVRSASEAALAAQNSFQARCREEGGRLLEALDGGNRRGAVLIGRPYNTTDRHVNLQLARRLKDLGIEPVPFDFLPLDHAPLPPMWERIRWGYGRKLVQAARILKRHPGLGAVIVTNFGCGPDAFVDQYLETELKEVPHILIELDDHQAEAGVVTRIEAFARNFKARSSPAPPLYGKDPGKPRRPLRQYTYYVPSFMDHAYAITGALRASGCKTVLLPPTDERSWNLGLSQAYGRECHPFIAFAGDLLKAAQRPGFEPETACYFGPSYFGPCLLPQYPLALHLILEKSGLGGVTVMNITDPTNMRELGPAYMIRLAMGLYAIDRLYKWKTEIEPHEAAKGQVQSVYGQILVDLEKGLAEGAFLRSLRRSVARFREIPLSQSSGARPRIGIVGDVYTRVNAHSNDRLYHRLNQMGFEVWTSSSVIDVSFLAVEQRHAELARQGRPARAAAARALVPALNAARWFLDRFFPGHIRTPQERHFPDVHRVSSRYASFWIDKALSLNLNRIEELHRAGADGIINVMCHNCMLGTVTASLSKSIRRDIGDTPLCSLVYEGLKSTHNINRLEAFAHQVRSFSRSRCRRGDAR
jgi:predicted CoA-substrate-specific enzyme activase